MLVPFLEATLPSSDATKPGGHGSALQDSRPHRRPDPKRGLVSRKGESEAQRRRRTACGERRREARGGVRHYMRGLRVESRVRGERANPGDHDSRTDRHGDADTERGDDDVRFGVIAVLKGVIPLIEYLHDGSTDANRQNRRDRKTS
jgi:hypothetical protein